MGRPPHGWPEFMANVTVLPNGCWQWGGRTDGKGYGMFKDTRAHIWAYTEKVGPVPEGMVLDHWRCDNVWCANYEHVRPETNRVNVLRGTSFSARNHAKTECPTCGGPYERNSRGQRFCRPCRNARKRRWRRGEV